MKKLYLYSTPSWYENRIKLNEIPFLKIGHTETQTVSDRIQQQDTTSNPEALICMGEYDVDFNDTDFHDWLEEQGYERSREDKLREFFNITKEQTEYELEIFKRERLKTASKNLKELKLYEHQVNFVNKILNSWKDWDSSLDFLLFAKCRSGKSVMVLSAIDNLENVKVSAVLSRFNSPKKSWINDSESFKNFENIVAIDTKINGWENQYKLWSKTNKKILLVGTIQGFKKIKNLPIDLVVYDEAHVGYNASDWKRINKKLNCPVIYVSGTAYKLQDDFADSMKYVYTYFEEQRDKKLSKRLDAPSVKVMYRKYDTTGGKKYFGQQPDALQNIFNVDDDGNFIDHNAVLDFVISEFGNQRHIQPNQRLLKNSTHIFLTINSVPAAHAIEDVFSSTRFSPLVVTGDTKEDQSSIEKHIKDNPSGTIIITKLANVLGLTVKEIDTVVNFSEGKSVEVWTQVMFRGGSSSKDWKYIDYSPERCLFSIRDLYFSACDRNPDIAEFKLTDYFPIAEWMDGEKELNEEMVNKILSSDPSNAIKLMANTPVGNKNILDDIDFFNLHLRPSVSNVVKNINLFTNDSEGKKNKINDGEIKKIEITKSHKEKTVKAIKERLPLVIYREIKDGNNSCNVFSLLKSKHYINDTGDNINILQKCLELGYENERVLNRRINQLFIDIGYSISQDDSKTLDKLSVSRKSQQQIPLELLDEMLTEVPICGKILIISDPSGLHSQRLIEKGCEPQNIMVWENDECHTYAIKQIDDKINVIYEKNDNKLLELKKLLNKKMKFDVIIANPPYQSKDANGKLRSSGTSPLWFKIVKVSKKLLKEDGWLSFITPSNIFFGGDDFSELFLGKKRELDLKKIFTNMKQKHFSKIGQDITRWLAQNSVTSNNKAILNDKMEIDTEKTLKVFDDDNIEIQEIFQTLMSYDAKKFELGVSGAADARGVSSLVKNTMGMSQKEADKYARDWSDVQSEEYPYAINSNDKIKYGKVKWKNYGQWKMMIPIMTSPFKYEIMVSDVVICDQSCNVQFFNNKEDALRAKEILDDPLYKWVLEQTRVSSRMCAAILSKLPVESIRNVLTSTQISYIESQL